MLARTLVGCALVLIAVTEPATAQSYSLVWSDEFDGSSVDLSKWEFQTGTGCPSLCGWGNNELQYYRAENASVSGGVLTITALEQAFGGRDYTSARMRTQNLGDFTYGRFEMRAKMPIGQGMWPAFWMLATASPYGIWPASGEIDIVEYLGNDPDRVFGTIHYGGPTPFFAGSDYVLPGATFHDDFHDFALEWDPFEIRWFVDGVQFGCNSHWWSSGGEYPAPFDQSFHLLLNLAVGGNLPGPPDGSTVFPQEYVVDYVRVYERTDIPSVILFDGMDHGNPLGNGWFAAGGAGGGGIEGSSDLPPTDGCRSSLAAGWGGPGPFIGAFGRTSPRDLTEMDAFTFWINPDPGQTYTLEVNLQEDDDGDDSVPSGGGGNDDEFQYALEVSPSGTEVIAGGGWQKVTIPFSSFVDDNSFLTGGNGVFDPTPVSAGGNGRLISVVFAVIAPGGGSQTFRTDYWAFEAEPAVDVPASTHAPVPGRFLTTFPNPYRPSSAIPFTLDRAALVSIDVFDAAGRFVRSLASGALDAGEHRVRWDATARQGHRVAPGIYFARLTVAGLVSDTVRVVLAR